jgi:hypothetical protein
MGPWVQRQERDWEDTGRQGHALEGPGEGQSESEGAEGAPGQTEALQSIREASLDESGAAAGCTVTCVPALRNVGWAPRSAWSYGDKPRLTQVSEHVVPVLRHPRRGLASSQLHLGSDVSRL